MPLCWARSSPWCGIIDPLQYSKKEPLGALFVFWGERGLPAGPERVVAVPSPRLAYRLGSCAPVGRVQDRRSWQRRPVRGRAPLALAHPLPCSYQGKGDSPRHGRGKILLYISFQRGSWRSPFVSPTGKKVGGGNTFLVIGAFGGYSLRHAAGVTPPSLRGLSTQSVDWGSF